MLQNKFIIALVFVATIMWGCTSGAMQIASTQNVPLNKIEAMVSETNGSIKAFTSAKEAKIAYKQLWQKEHKLMMASDNKQIESPEKAALEKAGLEKAWEKYHTDLMHFYQKLFRLIVTRDIIQRQPYTIILGMSHEEDGSITMERVPLSLDQVNDHNALLFKLSIYPDDPELLKQLQEYHKPNTAPGKSADQFFPKIVLEPNMDVKFDGLYNPKFNTITVAKSKFSLTHCIDMLHEFTHARQQSQIGGKSQLINQAFFNLTYALAPELDAEYESIQQHPCPKHLLAILEPLHLKILKEGWAWELTKKRFPYYPPAEQYLVTCLCHGLSGNDLLRDASNKLHEALMQEMQKIIQDCILLPEADAKMLYTNCRSAMECASYRVQNFEAHIAAVREQLLKNEKSAKLVETIKTTPSFIMGCKNYFEIKCKALGIILE